MHPDKQNIKKEGLGLIEEMGLVSWPGRLKRQLDAIEDILWGAAAYDPAALEEESNDLYVHRYMIADMLGQGKQPSKQAAHKFVEEYIGKVCVHILDNTAVFKRDEAGEAGFMQFALAAGLPA